MLNQLPPTKELLKVCDKCLAALRAISDASAPINQSVFMVINMLNQLLLTKELLKVCVCQSCPAARKHKSDFHVCANQSISFFLLLTCSQAAATNQGAAQGLC
jgi:hypothetical protein